MTGKKKRKGSAKDKASELLRTVPHHNAFYFFTDLGQYTGKFATNLSDFSKKIETIDAKAIQFHFKRQDFQKWTEETIGDSELADEISKIPKSSKKEKLREKIHKKVRTRVNQLKKVLASKERYLERT
ncbi:hypothetical protein GWN63_00925 [Candidatus Bathyarchaeota archaeon]|nr:hypothetical protein [Candidatus Bathyarchaeota archaeon]NIU80800.1 hypothetical protein [Candidatus Bathyarchaeota archaeon]NIV67425.1 hypothetical protein [Candidatus Bathyarchaeota archaeon]NIW15969.1 hypothetical protein [Candidatus Bathyarchaeota archaeon]NIW34071.1 hypothetical protein [Candidatus Bathyarchaeota archaeon]